MRLAILADIHANLIALESVLADLNLQSPDQVIVAGDLVNAGLRLCEVLDVLTAEWPDAIWLRGNHERYVAEYVFERERAPAIDQVFSGVVRITAEQLGHEYVAELDGLGCPCTQHLAMVHVVCKLHKAHRAATGTVSTPTALLTISPRCWKDYLGAYWWGAHSVSDNVQRCAPPKLRLGWPVIG